MRRLFFVATLLLIPASAFAGNPWEELMGPGKPRLWTDPQARFYLDLPIGWQVKAREGTDIVDFWRQHQDYGYTAHVTVEMRQVPSGVKTRHFALRVQQEVKSAAPGYKLISETRHKVSGANAVHTHFTYQEKNNVQLVNEVEQYIFVIGERAFIITMETAYGTASVFEEDFTKMIRRFVGRAPGEESLPLPKKRKRIRAGEMVNPDAVKY